MKERSVSTGQGRKRPASRHQEEQKTAANPFNESLDVFDDPEAREGRRSHI